MQSLSPPYGGLGVVSRNEKTGAITEGDEINRGDTLTLSFANMVKIVGFHFWDKGCSSSLLNSGDLFGLSIDGGATKQLTLADFAFYGGSSMLIGKSLTFSYVNEGYDLGAKGSRSHASSRASDVRHDVGRLGRFGFRCPPSPRGGLTHAQ